MELVKKKNRIIVAMSGGVDSSVAAALLKKQGYGVAGVFMHFWSEEPKNNMPLSDFVNRCCSLEAEKMAHKVCDIIGIPFYTINVAKEFKKEVVDYFLSEFNSGRTPNPCIVCNKEIKFKFLLRKALELGTDFVATGHYARKAHKKDAWHLFMAADKNKDQSYFLYNITQDQLAYYMFPVGDFLKSDVRKMAKKFKLPTADRPESQEICFIADNDIRRFLKEHLKLIPGEIVDSRGKVIGRHEGLPLFTTGQRHGLGIGGGKPYYVAGMDYSLNRLIVTSDDKDEILYRKFLIAKNVNWISGKLPEMPLRCLATARYRHKPERAVVERESGDRIRVSFITPQRAITPGQSAVFYKGEEVLGGGIID